MEMIDLWRPFAVLGIFWVGSGFYIVREEIKQGNKALTHAKPFLKYMGLACIYGPFLRRALRKNNL